MMELHQILDLMGELKLTGMRHAYVELVANAIKRQLPVQHVISDLLKAEIAEKKARSTKYQMTASRLPLAKEMDTFEFTGTPINEGLERDLATGAFLASQRNVVLVGGTGSGKSHLSIAIARNCVRNSSRVRFYNTTDLVNRLQMEKPTRPGRQARREPVAARPPGPGRTRLPALRANRRPALVPSDQPALRAHLRHCHHQPRLRRMADRLR